MARPANFTQILRLIQTLNGLPRTGCSTNCGHTIDTIHAAHNDNFPNNTLTLDEVTLLLEQGAGQGAFRKGGFHGDTNFYFHINPEMASVNTSNAHYVNAGLVVDLNAAGPGYLPCGQYEGFQYAPYGVAVSYRDPIAANNAVDGGSLLGNVGLAAPPSCD